MKGNRLNKSYREAIHADVMRYRFTKQVHAIIAEEATI